MKRLKSPEQQYDKATQFLNYVGYDPRVKGDILRIAEGRALWLSSLSQEQQFDVTPYNGRYGLIVNVVTEVIREHLIHSDQQQE
jgi:hypothetical protein